MAFQSEPFDLNVAAAACFDRLCESPRRIRGQIHEIAGARVLDVGVNVPGSLDAGLGLAKLCLGAAGDVTLSPAEPESVADWQVTIRTDHPIAACLGAQYAGWPVSVGDFFAMASGPMRQRRGCEDMLTQLNLVRSASVGEDADSTGVTSVPGDLSTQRSGQPDSDQLVLGVGVLESTQLPGEDAVMKIASDCGIPASYLSLAIAPSTSIAGSVQVVARSVETAMHKLHALDFDVQQVVSALGVAPLPPPAKPGDTIAGIGRTNDAMLYGARVTIMVDADDRAIDDIAARIPSNASPDHGRPFQAIFKDYDYDFYRVDAMLFSPAVVTIHNLRTGRSWRRGRLMSDLLRASFGS
ncbi:MAG: methenyltetrahydromethanopterin cyclohydrolase [Planctomycetota bacterium]